MDITSYFDAAKKTMSKGALFRKLRKCSVCIASKYLTVDDARKFTRSIKDSLKITVLEIFYNETLNFIKHIQNVFKEIYK